MPRIRTREPLSLTLSQSGLSHFHSISVSCWAVAAVRPAPRRGPRAPPRGPCTPLPFIPCVTYTMSPCRPHHARRAAAHPPAAAAPCRRCDGRLVEV